MNADPSRPWAAVGARIRDARLAAGFSQEAFAEAIGTSRRHVMRLEGGMHRPSRPMLTRIAQATGRDAKVIDPDAKEGDMQVAAMLLELLRVHVREMVRSELSAISESGGSGGGPG